MPTPFEPGIDARKLVPYITNHSPEEMMLDSRKWPCDFTEILTIADVLMHLSENMPIARKYAVELYAEGLRRLEEHKDQTASDTNVAGSYVRLGSLLSSEGRVEEAIGVYKRGLVETSNPALRAFLAVALFAIGRFNESLHHIQEVFQLPSGLLTDTIPPNVLQGLKEYRSRMLGRI